MSRWATTALKYSKNVVMFLIILVLIWFVYRMTLSALRTFLLPKPTTEPVKDANGVPQVAPADFATTDIVKFNATLGLVNDIDSDRTLDALLSGVFGPVVVLVYADWCHHCKNMMPAYEQAAKTSPIPFVRIQGHKAPVTARKHMIAGYPTIFGVANVNGVSTGAPPRRYASARSAEAFVEFAVALQGSKSVEIPAVATNPPVQQVEMKYPPNFATYAVPPTVAPSVPEVPKEILQSPEGTPKDNLVVEVLKN